MKLGLEIRKYNSILFYISKIQGFSSKCWIKIEVCWATLAATCFKGEKMLLKGIMQSKCVRPRASSFNSL